MQPLPLARSSNRITHIVVISTYPKHCHVSVEMTTFGVIKDKKHIVLSLNPLRQHDPRYARIVIHEAHVAPIHE